MSAVFPAPGATPPPALHAVMRALATAIPDAQPAEHESPLEHSTPNAQPAKLISATVIEGRELRAREVPGDPAVGFSAFLDGTQKSQVAGYVRAIPVIFGTVGAVVRERRDRRMYTWRHSVNHRLYAPRAQLSSVEWERIGGLGLELADSTRRDGTEPSEHPSALREDIVQRVTEDRTRAEQRLAIDWCDVERRRLMIDGGIAHADRVARSEHVVGVVKSHRSLYASGAALGAVLRLKERERSSVFLIEPEKRASVASWYLRIRDARGRDPMWGLVRIEVAPGPSGDALTERADEVSRWIL
ncbi:MAG TPA: hypothetical protein VIP11_12920, partial [Gemmatimonadaceae bacterium]